MSQSQYENWYRNYMQEHGNPMGDQREAQVAAYEAEFSLTSSESVVQSPQTDTNPSTQRTYDMLNVNITGKYIPDPVTFRDMECGKLYRITSASAGPANGCVVIRSQPDTVNDRVVGVFEENGSISKRQWNTKGDIQHKVIELSGNIELSFDY